MTREISPVDSPSPVDPQALIALFDPASDKPVSETVDDVVRAIVTSNLVKMLVEALKADARIDASAIKNLPQGGQGITHDAARDVAGILLASLDAFDYDQVTHTLTMMLRDADIPEEIARAAALKAVSDAVAELKRRLDAIPHYAADMMVWPPNVAKHSDFQRDFQSTLAGLDSSLATNAGATGTRFTNVFRIFARNADGDVVQLHTQGWAYTEDDRQTIPWAVDADEFNKLGTESATNGIEVWGEFRAVYGGGVDEFRGRTNPVFIDFGEEADWPATRGEIPEQRVLQGATGSNDATVGKLVIARSEGYLTRDHAELDTPARAASKPYEASDYAGGFPDSDVPPAIDHLGEWYWNEQRLTAFRAFRDDVFGAVWTAIDVNRAVLSGDYYGQWASDEYAAPHVTQVGDLYANLGGQLRVITEFTAAETEVFGYRFARVITDYDVAYAVSALAWDITPAVIRSLTAEAIAGDYAVTLATNRPIVHAYEYRLRIGVMRGDNPADAASDWRKWDNAASELPAFTVDAPAAASIRAALPAGQRHMEAALDFRHAEDGAPGFATSYRRIEFASAESVSGGVALPFADIRLYPGGLAGTDFPSSLYVALNGKVDPREIDGLTLVIGGQQATLHASTPVSSFNTESHALARFDLSASQRDGLSQNSAGRASQDIRLTFSFTTGADYVYGVTFPVNSPALVPGGDSDVNYDSSVQAVSDTGEAGDRDTVARGDHVHPLNLTPSGGLSFDAQKRLGVVAATSAVAGRVRAITAAVIDTGTSTGIFGWSIAHINRQVAKYLTANPVSSESEPRTNFGLMTVARTKVADGYEFTGYATTLPSGSLAGEQSEPISGIYTATVRTSVDPAYAAIEEGKTYFAQNPSGDPSVPLYVIIDDVSYDVVLNTGRFYEVVDFGGFLEAGTHRVQVIFTNGKTWIQQQQNLPPFADIRLLPEAVPGSAMPDDFYVELGDKLTSRTIDGLSLTIQGQTVQPHASTPIAGFDTEGQALVRFDISALADTIANGINANDRALTVDLVFSFTEGNDYRRRIILPVNNPLAPRLVPEALDTIAFNAALALDWLVDDMRSVTLTADVTFAFSNIQVGRPLVLEVVQDATGGKGITWPASVEWAGGSAEGPTAAGNAVDIFTLLPLSKTRVVAAALLNVS